MALNPLSYVLGLDPGLNGGIAVMLLDGHQSPGQVTAQPMPVKPGAKSGCEVDSLALARLFHNLLGGGVPSNEIKLAAIELVHAMPGQGVTSTFSFGMGYGKLLGVLESLAINTIRVPPQRWKKAILDGLGRKKSDAIRFVLSRFPGISLRATERSKKEHDGMAEAVCLAEYARRQLQLGSVSSLAREELECAISSLDETACLAEYARRHGRN